MPKRLHGGNRLCQTPTWPCLRWSSRSRGSSRRPVSLFQAWPPSMATPALFEAGRLQANRLNERIGRKVAWGRLLLGSFSEVSR